ncbi:hypothetical protein ACNKHR_26545 [Shigella flexneri]
MHGVFGYSRWKNDEFLAAIAHWFSTQHYTAIDSQTVVYGPSVILYGFRTDSSVV